MSGRRHIVITMAALAAVAVAATGSVLVLGPGEAAARVSNRGTPAAPNANDRQILEQGGFRREIRVLSARRGAHVARVEKADGTECFATSVRPEQTLLGLVRCDPKFPSERPVLDFSVYGAERGSALRLIRAFGIVTDDVSEVRLLSSSGAVVRTVPVEDNVFSLDEPSLAHTAVQSVVAVDDEGEAVARLGP
jgi:hypothetical protein